MNVLQFLRIFWARKFLILAVTAASFIGALAVVTVFPPRWDAHSRVLLSVLKPDPVTGLVPPNATTRAYVSTQLELVTDYNVAGETAELLGWLSDPTLIAQYQARSSSEGRDYRRWLAQLIIDRTKAKVLEDSNIMEITYVGSNPETARTVADTIRKAYIDQSLTFKRDDANRNAAFFEGEAGKAKAQLDAAEVAESEYERSNGIIMQDDKVDIDTARLRALALTGPSAPLTLAAPGSSAASVELAQLDVQIAEAEKSLGPNHPDLLAMKARRASIASLVSKERSATASNSSAISTSAGNLDRAVQAQKSRVLAQSGKLSRLQQLQAEVDLRRDQLNKASARVADLRQEAAVDNTGITPLGGAVTPQHPSFPNTLLILPGATIAGLMIGILLSILAEIFGRRVRGPEDLAHIPGVALIAVINDGASNSRILRFREDLLRILRRRRQKLA